MDELKLPTRKKIRVWVDEVNFYDVAKPTNRDLYEYSKSEGEEFPKAVAFLAKLGLPEDVTWALVPEHVQSVMTALIPQQKKS